MVGMSIHRYFHHHRVARPWQAMMMNILVQFCPLIPEKTWQQIRPVTLTKTGSGKFFESQ